MIEEGTRQCHHCNLSIANAAKFCGSCGVGIHVLKNEKLQKSVVYIIAFYLSFLLLAIINTVVFANDYSLSSEITVEVIFIFMTLGFCFLDWKNILKLYTIKGIDTNILLLSILFPIFSAFFVYYGIEWLNNVLVEYTENMYSGYVHYEYPLVYAIVFIAILPPIFEELAFRGFLFNQMRKVSSVQVTIIGTSFIFALVHFSLISFLWIFPFGMFLGYLRHRYQMLWLGMIVHFIHNLLVLMLDYYYYANL
jgi:membrane protease YdiL (CAAX protease family)